MPDKKIKGEIIVRHGLRIDVTLYFWTENRSKERKGFYLSINPVLPSGEIEISKIQSKLIQSCARFNQGVADDVAAKMLEKAEPIIQDILMKERKSLDPTEDTFVYTQDPGHGWLGVPVWLVKEVGATPSKYSYISDDGTIAYLEEDSDMGKFMDLYLVRYKQPVKCKSIQYQESSHIRNCSGYPQ